MPPIASYVFIDLETTSIPSLELNKTKITELSLVAVKRSHVLETSPGASPRVQHKLTLCFNPGRMIDPGSTEATGLCNDLLEHETMFNMNAFSVINGFIKSLKEPVCLVAQNGHNFDFPILKAHFEKLGVSLSDSVLCADSLHAFYDILEGGSQVKMCEKSGSDVCDFGGKINPDSVINNDNGLHKIQRRIIEQDKTSKNKSDEDIKQDNTVVSELELEDNDLIMQRNSQNVNETTPKQSIIKAEAPKRIGKVRRKLFWGKNRKPEVSYQLKEIYKRVLNRPPLEAHRAEIDCVMAMEISVAKSKRFVDWVDNNSCPFNEVNAMKLGVPLGE